MAIAPNGDIFVSDGHNVGRGNARVVKFTKDGKYQFEWGTRGSGPGEFALPLCAACGDKQVFPPRAICPHCGSTDLRWQAASGAGTVHSTTVVRDRPENGADRNIAPGADAPRRHEIGPGELRPLTATQIGSVTTGTPGLIDGCTRFDLLSRLSEQRSARGRH